MERTEGLAGRGQLLDVLVVGECEPLKAAVHGVVMVTVAVCALYNAAAWLRRRERHLAVNAMVYGCAAVWEHRHVQDHLACRPVESAPAERENPLPDAA